jgi:hypothetical protein
MMGGEIYRPRWNYMLMNLRRHFKWNNVFWFAEYIISDSSQYSDCFMATRSIKVQMSVSFSINAFLKINFTLSLAWCCLMSETDVYNCVVRSIWVVYTAAWGLTEHFFISDSTGKQVKTTVFEIHCWRILLCGSWKMWAVKLLDVWWHYLLVGFFLVRRIYCKIWSWNSAMIFVHCL